MSRKLLARTKTLLLISIFILISLFISVCHSFLNPLPEYEILGTTANKNIIAVYVEINNPKELKPLTAKLLKEERVSKESFTINYFDDKEAGSIFLSISDQFSKSNNITKDESKLLDAARNHKIGSIGYHDTGSNGRYFGYLIGPGGIVLGEYCDSFIC